MQSNCRLYNVEEMLLEMKTIRSNSYVMSLNQRHDGRGRTHTIYTVTLLTVTECVSLECEFTHLD